MKEFFRGLLLVVVGFIGGVFYALYAGESFLQGKILDFAKNGYQNTIERMTDQPIEDNELDEALQGGLEKIVE